MPSEFKFCPETGELEAFQKVHVRVVFTPLACRRVRSVVECNVMGNQPRFNLLTPYKLMSDNFDVIFVVVGMRDVGLYQDLNE